jgi:hypothetical protein
MIKNYKHIKEDIDYSDIEPWGEEDWGLMKYKDHLINYCEEKNIKLNI